MSGYFDGVLDVYYAKMTTEDTSAANATYDTPKVLAKTIEITITPEYKEGQLYASNAAVRDVRVVDKYTVSLNLDKVPGSVLKDLLNRTQDSNGVQIIKGSAKPANVAIGFACTLDDGTKELWWLYKGTFAEISKTAATSSDAMEYQTPTLEGTFVRRVYDDALAAVVENGGEDIGESVESGWFTQVYETAAAAG